MKLEQYATLEKEELKKINGGISWVGPALGGLGYVLKDGWDHLDQIGAGIKKGWNNANKNFGFLGQIFFVRFQN